MTHQDDSPVSYQRRNSAFTLIELMVAVAIIGVLASMAGTSYQTYVEKARTARAIAELQSIARILDSYEIDGGTQPANLDGIADGMVDPWGNPYQYLQIAGGLPPGIALNTPAGLPHVSSPGGGGGGSVMGSVRKDRFLVPINTDYDLYSNGVDGETKKSLQNKVSRDDVIRASNGAYFGLAEGF